MWDYEDCARLTAAEPHAKETSHRAKAITSSDQPRQYTLRPNRGFGPRIFLHGLTACVASSAPQPFSRFDSVIAHLPSCLKWVFPDPSSPDHVMGPSVSTFATCSQLTPSSSDTRALARRANRCVTDPSRANATWAERSSRDKKPGRIMPRPESNTLPLARVFLPSQ